MEEFNRLYVTVYEKMADSDSLTLDKLRQIEKILENTTNDGSRTLEQAVRNVIRELVNLQNAILAGTLDECQINLIISALIHQLKCPENFLEDGTVIFD